jgi:predicted AlkP superfamily pyrophosphatase or phosphodiesterase
MTEDQELDFAPGSFKNPDTGETIESIWDVMRKEGKTFAVEACVALGARSYRGITTHGARVNQLLAKIRRGVDMAYIQFSETDQQMHVRGTSPEARGEIVSWADSQVKLLYDTSKELYQEVDLIVFGDHGMMDVTQHADLPLEYPPFIEGWDYLYLKSSAAIQFWTFNKKVDKYIYHDPKLKQYGSFIDSPSKRQGDIVWLAKPGLLVSPCHFHPKWDAPKAMHGFNPHLDEMKGFAIYTHQTKKVVDKGTLKDICPMICDSMAMDLPKYNEGNTYVKRS